MRIAIIALAGAALAIAGVPPVLAKASGRNAPSLAACGAMKPVEGTERERAKPIAIPRAWSGVARSDLTRIAVSTLGGRTVCIDTSWMEMIERPTLGKDQRFLGFDWFGYEAYGHILVDRAGKGAWFDTGAAPVASPSGRYLASLEYSESSFGSLNGFMLLDVGADSSRQIAKLELPEGLTDWQLDAWQGDACVRLSAVRFDEAYGENRPGKPPRHLFLVRPAGKSWRIAAGDKRGCAAR